MNKKTTQAAIGGTGIIALALLTAAAQAESVRYTDVTGLNVGMQAATAAAQQGITGEIIEAELELENDQSVWEIDIINEANQVMTVNVDGHTGQILKTESDDDAAPNLDNVVSLNKAIDIIKAIETGALIEAELENEHGELVWEIETVNEDDTESEFRVHALTGEIL